MTFHDTPDEKKSAVPVDVRSNDESDHTTTFVIDKALEKRVLRKTDMVVLPMVYQKPWLIELKGG